MFAMTASMRPILDFFRNRKMILNCRKTNFMIFKSPHKKIDPLNDVLSENVTISQVEKFKYLGLWMDEHLKWQEHLKHLEKKLAPVNGILWKLRNVLPLRQRKIIYATLFESHLNFMSSIWGLASCNIISNAQILQNRALRNVYQLPNQQNRVEMFVHLVENHLPIRGICVLSTATYMFNVSKDLTHCNLNFERGNEIHRRPTRISTDLRPEFSKTTKGGRAIATFGPKLMNKIPEAIKSSRHQHAFKWVLKCELRKKKFISSFFNASFFELNII